MNKIYKRKLSLSLKDAPKIVSQEKKELILPSQIESVEESAQIAATFATACGLDEIALFGIDMAVREAVANAVKHGNKFDETKKVSVTLANSPELFEISIKDEGAGFAVEDVPDPTNPENLLKASGRGILFMKNFMDEVEWANHPNGGTIVRMAKKR